MGCIMSTLEGDERGEDGDGKEGSEFHGGWQRVEIDCPLVCRCGDSEDLRVMVGTFAELCRKRGLKVNVGKNNDLVLNGEEGMECEVHLDGIRLEHVSEFKYLECVLDESGTDGA